MAGVLLAVAQLAEPILFGRMVDALASGSGAFGLIGLWAGFGLFGILAGALVATAADRLAHRRRLAAMAGAFERAITLPSATRRARHRRRRAHHPRRHRRAFGLWLAVLREQLTAVVAILLLIPTAIGLDARMAAILGVLAAAYLALNLLVIRKTRAGQRAVERHHGGLAGRVGDVIGNVTVVQSYTRLAAEMQAMRGMMDELLEAQYPVLTWWGLLTVLTRAAATIAMVLVFAAGALLMQRGEITVGEVVAFAAFADAADRQARPALRLRPGVFGRPRGSRATSSSIDAAPRSRDRPGAPTSPSVAGPSATRACPTASRAATGRLRPRLRGRARRDRRAGRPDRRRQDHHARAAPAPARAATRGAS